MKKRIALMVLILVSFVSHAEQVNNPYELVQQVANATFERIKRDNELIQNDQQALKRLLQEELMPHVNYKLAAKLLLGKTVGTKQQKSAFYKAFERYLVKTYATVFSKYADQRLVVNKPVDIKNKKVVTVKTRLVDSNRPDVHIDFKLRLKANSSHWMVYDMVVEGVSLLDSQKAELKGILRQPNGIDTATQMLTDRVRNKVTPSSV